MSRLWKISHWLWEIFLEHFIFGFCTALWYWAFERGDAWWKKRQKRRKRREAHRVANLHKSNNVTDINEWKAEHDDSEEGPERE